VKPEQMLLGSCSNEGTLRYYWKGSCQVFAHGPDMGQNACSSSNVNNGSCHNNPQAWDPSDPSHANVFDRWGPVLDPSLRMACGSSTDVPINPAVTQSIWRNYTVRRLSVADSFINGIWNAGGVGICITRGGEDMETTPLVTDSRFTTQANTAGDTHYHMLYTQTFTEPYNVFPTQTPSIPKFLPILTVSREEVDITEDEEQTIQFDFDVNEEEYIAQATGYLNSLDAQDLESVDAQYITVSREPTGVHLRLTSLPIDYRDSEQEISLQIAQKNAFVAFRQQLDLNAIVEDPDVNAFDSSLLPDLPERVDILGAGGLVEFQMNSTPSIHKVSFVQREIIEVSRVLETISYEEAEKEAQSQLGEYSEGLVVGNWTWGYRDVGEPQSRELYPFYEFRFIPGEERTSYEYPPQVVYVPAVRE
jgi:hypothetical protein